MVSTLAECELYAAVAHWLTSNSYASSYRMLVNFPATGHTTLVDKIEWRLEPPQLPTAQNLIDAYNAYLTMLDDEQSAATVESGSKAQASNIPNWASWTEAQALSWHDTNVANAIAPIANLADAKVVLTQMATENRALVRMLIALRNKAFPDLQG